MSKNSLRRYTTTLFVLVVSVAVVCADLVVLAQNANSAEEPTRGGVMTTQNGNMSGGTTTPRRRSRQRRRARTRANANTMGDMSGTTTDATANTTDTGMAAGAGMTQDNTNTGGTGRRRRRRRGRATTDMSGGTATTGMGMTANANSGGEQTDLSGTYTGTVNYPEGGLNGPATLTITGNSFTIAPEGGGSSVTGRVTAVTTRGYTGVTMMFGDATAPPPTQNPPPPPLPAVSLQARRSGDRVTLTSVPGERRQFSFSSGAAAGGTGRRRTRRRARRSSGTGHNMAHSIQTQ